MTNPLSKLLAEELQRIVDVLAISAKDEVRAQGHVASGRGIASIKAQSGVTPTGAEGWIECFDYMITVSNGLPIGTNVPLNSLIEWAGYVQASMSSEERVKFAQKVQRAIRQQGSPTGGAFAFSENGRRKDWIDYGITIPAEELLQGNFFAQRLDVAVQAGVGQLLILNL